MGPNYYSPKNDGNRPHTSVTIVCKKLQLTEMLNQAMELDSVIYNAANQSFAALATVYGGTSSHSIACANNAPIDIILIDDAKGLSTQALHRFSSNPGLSSVRIGIPFPIVRAGRSQPRKVIDAFGMLRQLAT